MSFLKAQVNLFSNFSSIFSTIKHNSSVLFYLEHYIIWSKEPIKVQSFQIFKDSGQNSSNSSCVRFEMTSQFLFKHFASFFMVMTHNSSVNFKLIHFLLWKKGSHQSPNFDIFHCSGENLPNSSCHFSNHKSVFLQILRHSSAS